MPKVAQHTPMDRECRHPPGRRPTSFLPGRRSHRLQQQVVRHGGCRRVRPGHGPAALAATAQATRYMLIPRVNMQRSHRMQTRCARPAHHRSRTRHVRAKLPEGHRGLGHDARLSRLQLRPVGDAPNRRRSASRRNSALGLQKFKAAQPECLHRCKNKPCMPILPRPGMLTCGPGQTTC